MKIERQAKLLEIISTKDIVTQEELADELKKQGMDITQATVSRDIKELKLIKVLTDNGTYKYAAVVPSNNPHSNRLVNIFSQTVLSVQSVGNFVCVKTMSGSGGIAGEAIDSLGLEGIVGTIAGDNTIFVLVINEEKANEISKKMKKMISK
jgi:transcriptional regulator of arginine metabolism